MRKSGAKFSRIFWAITFENARLVKQQVRSVLFE